MNGNRDPGGTVYNQLPPPGRANYGMEEVEREGQMVQAFVKWSTDERVARLIENEAAVSTKINRLGADASLPFRAPTVYSSGEGRITTEWLPGRPLSEENPTPISIARIVASIAVTFDRKGAGSVELARFNFFETQQETRTRIEQELMKSVENGVVDKQVVQDGLAFFDELYPSLASCWQHADLVPKHLYPEEASPKEADAEKTTQSSYRIAIIDAEHMRADWPKYYDLGNLLARSMVYHPDAAFATEVLTAYMGMTDEPQENIIPSLKAVLAYRSLTVLKGLAGPGDDLQAAQIGRAQQLLAALPGVESVEDLVQMITAIGQEIS